MVDLDVVIYEIPEVYVPITKADPIIIRGSGDITIFGMNNAFSNDFPPELHGKVAPEEFQETISKVNSQLRRSMSINLKWLLCGFICCFCTLGCSMWPAICVNRKVKRSIEKTLELENARLYCQLGLNWSLAKQRSSEPVVLMEYVLRLDFIPKSLYKVSIIPSFLHPHLPSCLSLPSLLVSPFPLSFSECCCYCY
uniref:Cysteine rich hydrophobic domain 1 protein n=1 Tax=Echinococcus granulosus TaxID=6210 RepID=A0A068W722_ECHGR|nr:cysteine rich hydrophobic domain 1 protein [Echinococcus granulosus]